MNGIKYVLTSFNNLKIRYKLLSVYSFVIVLPLLGVGFYLSREVQRIMINQVLQETSTNMDRIEERLNNLFDDVLEVSDLLTINENLIKLASHEYQNNLEVFNMHERYRVFDDFLIHYNQIDDIRFYSLNPTMLQVGNFFKATETIIANDWFQDAIERDGGVSWILKTDELTNKDYFTLTRLVKDRVGTPLGVLNVYISSLQLKTIFQDEPYEIILVLNQKIIIFQEGELVIGEEPPFLELINEEQDSYVLKNGYGEGGVRVNQRRINPHRVLDNELQIATIIPIEEVTLQVKIVMQKVFLVVGGCLLASLGFILIFVSSFNQRIKLLKDAMDQVASGNFIAKPSIKGNDEINEIYHKLYETMVSIQQLMREIYMQRVQNEEWKVRQKESEFKWLTSQINPHFLYNTLEMIRVKAIKSQAQDVAQIVKLLSKLLRRSLESHDQLISLKKEIEFTEMYLEIQKLRFKDKIDYEIQIEMDSERYQVIPLLIQPIVENAFIHGVELKEGNGTIKIKIYQNQKFLMVEVEDNGVGIDSDRLVELEKKLNQPFEENSTSIGITNVQQRLKLYYGSTYGIEMNSKKGEGTKVSIYLPKAFKGEN